MSRNSLLERVCLHSGLNQRFFEFLKSDVLLSTFREVNTHLFQELPNQIHSIILTNPRTICSYIKEQQNSPKVYCNVRQLKLISDYVFERDITCLSLLLSERCFPMLSSLTLHGIHFKSLEISSKIPLSRLEMCNVNIKDFAYLPPAYSLVSLSIYSITKNILPHLFRLSLEPDIIYNLHQKVRNQKQQENKEQANKELESKEQENKEQENKEQENKELENKEQEKKQRNKKQIRLQSLLMNLLELSKTTKNHIQQTFDICKDLQNLSIQSCSWKGILFFRHESLKHLDYSGFVQSRLPALVIYHSKQLEQLNVRNNKNIFLVDQEEKEELNFPELLSMSFRETQYFQKLIQLYTNVNSVHTKVFPFLIELHLSMVPIDLELFTEIVLPSLPRIEKLRIEFPRVISKTGSCLKIHAFSLRNIFICFKLRKKSHSVQIIDCPQLEEVEVLHYEQLFLQELPKLRCLLVGDPCCKIHCKTSILKQLKTFGCYIQMEKQRKKQKKAEKQSIYSNIQEKMKWIEALIQNMENVQEFRLNLCLSLDEFQECLKKIILIQQTLPQLTTLNLIFLRGAKYKICGLNNIKHLRIDMDGCSDLFVSNCSKLQTLCISTETQNFATSSSLVLEHLPMFTELDLTSCLPFFFLSNEPITILLRMSYLPQLSKVLYPSKGLICIAEVLNGKISSIVQKRIETQSRIRANEILQRKKPSSTNYENYSSDEEEEEESDDYESENSDEDQEQTENENDKQEQEENENDDEEQEEEEENETENDDEEQEEEEENETENDDEEQEEEEENETENDDEEQEESENNDEE